MLEDTFTQLVQYLTEVGWVGLAVALGVGLVVALAGYRLRLLFFFVVGFYAGAVTIGPLFAAMIDAPQTAVIFGAIAGVVAGFVAVRLYFVALFLMGLLAGASLLVTAVGSVLPEAQLPVLIAAAIGGVLGGVAAIVLDRIAVIVASAWVGGLHVAGAGSTAVYRGAGISESLWYMLFLGILVVVTVIGVLYQSRMFPTQRYRYDRRYRRER